jgi:hypothetical protein
VTIDSQVPQSGCGFPQPHSRVHRLARAQAADEDPPQKGGHGMDILIGGLMALATIAVLAAIVLRIASRVGETPRRPRRVRRETAPALRPASGW